MSHSKTDFAREQLITLILGARTTAGVAAATAALDHWLQEHPSDTGMADGYEQLAMMEDSAEGQQAHHTSVMVETEMTALDAARERLCDQVFAARALPEVLAAQEALSQWLRDHPNEQGMRDGFEILSHREDFAREREAQRPLFVEERAAHASVS